MSANSLFSGGQDSQALQRLGKEALHLLLSPHLPPGSYQSCSFGRQYQEPLAKAHSERTGTACRGGGCVRLDRVPIAPDFFRVRPV